MSVINITEAIRARLSQMADEHLAMQEAMHDLPYDQVEAHCARMTAHAEEMSRLAARLSEPDSKLQITDSKLPESDNLKSGILNLESPGDDPEAA
jgi:DNA mismatch repair ATPase MutS